MMFKNEISGDSQVRMLVDLSQTQAIIHKGAVKNVWAVIRNEILASIKHGKQVSSL